MRGLTSRICRRLRWHPLSVEVRLLAHALRQGLWRSLSPALRKTQDDQQILTWSTFIPDRASSADIVSHLRQSGLRVREGGNAFYLPPQPGLAAALGAAVERYPPGSGFKVLRDFRGLDEAHYLHPARQTRLRRRLIGTPLEQLIAANYLHRLDLGPRVWDVCLLRAGRVPMPAFVVQHVEGTAPDDGECAAFLARLRAALSQTELRITVPSWERNKDFRCPGCNHNLLRDAGGRLNYIDFQNFTVRDPRRIPERPAGRPARAPGGRAGAGEGAQRFHMARRVLRNHGVELRDRVVLDVGCHTGLILRLALAAGAWWGLGWDRPAAAMQAQAMAVALGFTRLDIIPAELDQRYDLGASIPAWLDRHLEECVVFLLAARRPGRIIEALVDLPWRALVYEGHEGESLTEAGDHVRPLIARGASVAHRTIIQDTEARAQPLVVLVRQPATAGASAPAMPH